MSFEAAIHIRNLGKCYQMYNKPHDRLLQMLVRGRKQYYREFWALQDVSLEIAKGEVLGIVGSNGAGKSTLLQLVCGTLHPTTGSVAVQGRIAALLELGAGFNPEFSGRENVYLSATVMGLSKEEIDARYTDIVAFSGIADFIEQPVKTYSSGMYVRLAFSIAINIDPDILIIDEALSVGDGEFGRKSFERIMALKDAGKTILFCSHALYQVEALCNRAIWLDHGKVQVVGLPAQVLVAYNEYLDSLGKEPEHLPEPAAPVRTGPKGTARIVQINVSVDGESGSELEARSRESDVAITLGFASDPALPAPSVGVVITDTASRTIASSGTKNDGLTVARQPDGTGEVSLVFEQIPLLKGSYWIHVFLMCENAVHFYEVANMVAKLHVSQQGLEVGVVTLPHRWDCGAV
jgi:lipopolysaccharide transport system ATP-binding protein